MIIIYLYIISVVIAMGFFIPAADYDNYKKTYMDILFIVLFSLVWFIFLPVYICLIFKDDEDFHGFRYWFKNKEKPKEEQTIPDKQNDVIIIDLRK